MRGRVLGSSASDEGVVCCDLLARGMHASVAFGDAAFHTAVVEAAGIVVLLAACFLDLVLKHRMSSAACPSILHNNNQANEDTPSSGLTVLSVEREPQGDWHQHPDQDVIVYDHVVNVAAAVDAGTVVTETVVCFGLPCYAQ